MRWMLPLVLCVASADAHVVLEQKSAPAGQPSILQFRVIHGCEGSPTVGLRIKLPAGVDHAVARYRAGWTFTMSYGPPSRSGHKTISEIEWRGGTLPPDAYDVFEVELRLPGEPDEIVHFPAVQICAAGEIRHVDIAKPGALPWDVPNPAPSLRLAPAAGRSHD